MFPNLPLSPVLLLAVCKTKRRRPGPFCHVNDVSVYLGRQRGEGGGVPDCISHMLFVLKAIKNWTVERSELHLLVVNKRNDVSN